MPRWRTWRPQIIAERAEALQRLGNLQGAFTGELYSALKYLAAEREHPQELEHHGPIRCVGMYLWPGTLYVFFTSPEPRSLIALHVTAFVGAEGKWPPVPPPAAWDLARERLDQWGL